MCHTSSRFHRSAALAGVWSRAVESEITAALSATQEGLYYFFGWNIWVLIETIECVFVILQV